VFDPRKSARVQLVAKVEAQIATSSFLAAAGDVSEGGMLIFTGNPSSVGDAVQLDFSLPGSPKIISTKAVVVHVVPNMSMGVQFEGLEPEDLAAGRQFVGKAIDSQNPKSGQELP
jgi:hypothetical protein